MMKIQKLSENDQKIIIGFMKNFQLANSPSVIEFKSVKRLKNYLKVDVTINGRPEWFHVTSLLTWY